MKAERCTVIIILFIILMPAGKLFPENILVLNSYHQGYFWADRMMRGLTEEFKSHPDIELYINYMDTKRISDPQYLGMLRELYRYKYRDTDFDLIISADDHALDFLLENRNELFPEVPVVFTGINDFFPSRIEGQEGYTGIGENYDMQGNLELILRLHPEIKRIAVVLDDTLTGHAMEERLKRSEAVLPIGVALEYWMNIELEEITARLEKLGDETAVIWAIYLRKPDGEYISTRKSLSSIVEASALPVYCLWDVVGLGVIGGRVSDPVQLGSDAAVLALRILEGEDPASIPVVESPLTYIFDYRVMKEYGIRRRQLPKPRIIRNRPISFVREYPLVTALVFMIISLLLAIIIILQHYRKLEKAKTAVIIKTLEERTILIKELNHRAKNNMQMLISMISLVKSGIEDSSMQMICNELENRIYSISTVHSMLHDSENLSHISLRQYIEELVIIFRKNSLNSATGVHIKIDIQDIQINIDVAIGLGLVLNELFTNSCKHAFPSGEGEIRLKIVREGAQLHLLYSDDGSGAEDPGQIFSRNTLGMLTIHEIVTSQLRGTIEVSNSPGLTFSIRVFEESYKSRV